MPIRRPRTLTVLSITALLLPLLSGAAVSSGRDTADEVAGRLGERKPPPPALQGAPHGGRGAPDCLTAGSPLSLRPPIAIDGDEDLTSPASGVRSGSGTPDDPYVISGWLIPGQGAQLGQAVHPDVYGPASASAIQIHGTTKHVVIRENVMGGTGFPQGFDHGIVVEAPNVTIERNVVCSAILDGVMAEGANVTVRENEIWDARAGIWARSSPGVVVSGNTVDTSVFGIAVEDSPDATIDDNVVTASHWTGILVNYSDRAGITGNAIRGRGIEDPSPDDYGIYAYLSPETQVEGNTVREVGLNGIVLGVSQQAIARDNEVRGNGLAGMVVWDDWVLGRSVIADNVSSGNGTYGPGFGSFRSGIVIIDSHENLVEGNEAAGNWSHGIEVYATAQPGQTAPEPTRGTEIRGNLASQSIAGFGYGLSSDTGSVVAGNEATRNAGGGIRLQASGAIVEENLVRDNEGTGILVGGSAADRRVTLRGNEVQGNLRGVVLDGAEGVLLRDNTLQGNTYGFGIEGVVQGHFEHDLDASTTIDGKPVLVLHAPTGALDWAALDPGYLALVRPFDLTIRNVEATGSVHGLALFEPTRVRIEGGRFEGNEVGVDLTRPAASTIDGALFEDNATGARIGGDAVGTILRDSSFEGGGVGALFRGMEIPGTGYARPRGTLVEGNVFRGVRDVAIDSASEEATIRANSIEGPTAVGIDVNGAPVTIEGNELNGPGGSGILADHFFTTLRANVVAGFDRGIHVWYASGILVEENRLTGNGTGYFSEGGADGARIARNVVTDNHRGIDVRGEVWDTVIECNRVTGNELEGIGLAILTFRARVTANLIDDNGRGLHVGGALSQVTGNRISRNEVGISLAGSITPSIAVTGNAIAENSSFGAMVLTAGERDGATVLGGVAESAGGNWWGAASGPAATGNPGGSGDRVSDQIHYRPWLEADPAAAGACGAGLEM